MQKKYKIILIIIAVLTLLLGGIAVYFCLNKPKEEKKVSNVISNIKEYNYILEERDTKLMKDTFEELKDILDNEEIDYEAYAGCLSKLFIIDLYTIDNKVNKYDIGSLEYIFDNEIEKFSNMVMDTIYDQVVDNSDNKRNQKLPEVSQIEVSNILSGTYNIDNSSLDSYTIDLNWEYIEDLGYDKEGKVTVVKSDNKLFVVEYQPVISE